ncbi:MAG: multicopper oxidase domain-containing protein [Marmoricola sp.]
MSSAVPGPTLEVRASTRPPAASAVGLAGQLRRRLNLGWDSLAAVHAPSEQAEVAVGFTGYRGRYLVHCHNLEHEDIAMMAAFATV